MNFLSRLCRKKIHIVLGTEAVNDFIAVAVVEVGTVSRLLRVEQIPFEKCEGNTGLFQHLTKYINTLHEKIEMLAVADRDIILKTLPLREMNAGEIEKIIGYEMHSAWEQSSEQYFYNWYRQNENVPEIVVGLLEKTKLNAYRRFNDTASVRISTVCPAGTVEIGDKLICADNCSADTESTDLAKTFGGAIYAALVAGGKMKNVNLLHQNQSNMERICSWPYYGRAAKIVAACTAIILAGLILLWGLSYYRLYKAEENLQPLGQWEKNYDDCLALEGQHQQLQKLITDTSAWQPFRAAQVEKILDAMPDYNMEIDTMRMQQVRHNGGRKHYYLELTGKTINMKLLKVFIANLEQLKEFSHVGLTMSKNSGMGITEFVINLDYANADKY